MAAARRITRNIQVALSHSEKARRLSYGGHYRKALEELGIALNAFEAENRHGVWDDAVAGILNNIGFTHAFLGDYRNSEEAFLSALSIKERLGDRRSLAGTLVGLSDALRGQCRFGDSLAALERALDLSLEIKDSQLAGTIIGRMDALERARCDMPGAAFDDSAHEELYVPSHAADVLMHVARLSIKVTATGTIHVEADLGFPCLMKDLSCIGNEGQFPAMSILFPEGTESSVKLFEVTDEEEVATRSLAYPFEGLLFSPGSYHRAGPLPMPLCKEYIYTYGSGHILSWDVRANGWYRISTDIDSGCLERLRLYIGFPFGEVRLGQVSAVLADPGAWRMEKLSCGTFVHSRALDTSRPPLSGEMPLYEGVPAGEATYDKCHALNYGIVCLILEK